MMAGELPVSMKSRDRMIQSASELFREHGVSGTGLRDINARSGVPRGAIYHHFPGGKSEIAAAAATYAGDEVRTLLEAVAAESDPVMVVQAFVAGWAEHLRSHEFRSGCAIVAVAGEATLGSEVSRAAAEALSGWAQVFASALESAAVPKQRALRLGVMIVSAVEGAIILSRVQGTTDPLTDVGTELEVLIEAALHG
jgi:AcrR family transcriptional regulator